MEQLVNAILLLLISVPCLPDADTPKEKVLVYVVIDEGSGKASLDDLEDSAKDLKKQIEKREWLDLAKSEDDADIIIHLLDRWKQTIPNRNGRVGYALRYNLVAGSYSQLDDYVFGRLSTPGGIKPRGDLNAPGLNPHIETPLPGDGRQLFGDVIASWDELAQNLSKTLEKFARENYGRLMEQRK